MARAVRLLVALCALLPASAALADGWKVGVIVSASGPSAEVGRAQAYAAERSAAALARGGVFGAPFELLLRDDGGDPMRAAALAGELVDAGAHAVLCCTAPAATARVADALDARMTPHLALAEADVAGRFWSVSLAPTERAQLTAIAVDASGQGKASLAMMTLDSGFGADALEAFGRALADAGRDLAGEARYPADAAVLTPEGLWIATRQPGAVVVWGLSRDLPVAIDGLRRRGYEGMVYAREATLPAFAWDRLVPAGAHAFDPDDAWAGLRVALAPAALAGRLPPDHPHAAGVAAFVGRVLGGDPSVATPSERATMARVDDALVWLHAAFEQVAAIGLDSGAVTRRLAVRDALIGAPLTRLAAGAYDASEDDPRAARWQGLVVAAVAARER
ncbi:MAG: ABC transporter substrate-binding protein [Trueperaceae bacterium]|nr:ABC transporter substrate-binding protein [Trueperaceae bacterium]